jgi:ribonuclease P protein component
MPFTFSKKERLRSKLLFDRLFETGKSVYETPLKAIWMLTEEVIDTPCQVAVGIPKKKIRKAALRNSLKRKIRESYRLNKSLLLPFLKSSNIQLVCIILYNSSEMNSWEVINEAVNKILNKLIQKIGEINGTPIAENTALPLQ